MSRANGDPGFKDNGCCLAKAMTVALAAIEALDFNAWERCNHDSAAYREITGAPSLAEAAGAIRAALGQ